MEIMSKMNMALVVRGQGSLSFGWTELSVLLRGERCDDYNGSEGIIQTEGKERPSIATSGYISDSAI